jgi:transposase
MKTTTNKTSPAPSVVSTFTSAVVSGFTLGLDLGDRQHHVCVLDAAGQIMREASVPNTRPALAQLLAEFPHATVALEAGTHSPWISRYLTGLGATVLVANPRKLHAISRNEFRFTKKKSSTGVFDIRDIAS